MWLTISHFALHIISYFHVAATDEKKASLPFVTHLLFGIAVVILSL